MVVEAVIPMKGSYVFCEMAMRSSGSGSQPSIAAVCHVNDSCEGCAIASLSQTCTFMQCLVHLQAGSNSSTLILRCLLVSSPAAKKNHRTQLRPSANAVEISSMLPCLFSDTSQSTFDRTRYICTPRLSLPMSNAPPSALRETESKCSL
jgi:hypothetical protein